jgi:hypothetical protein
MNLGDEIPDRDSLGLVLVGIDVVPTRLKHVGHVAFGLLQGGLSP